jgi:hypothetical protein
MIATARFFLVDAAGRQQRFYSSFARGFTTTALASYILQKS